MRYTGALFLLTFALITAGGFSEAAEERGGDRILDAEIVTVGVDQATRIPAVVLRELEGGRTVSIAIGFREAQAILEAMHGIENPRPMTHDLAVNMLGVAGAQVEEVLVRDVRGGVFLGSIHLRVAGRDDLVVVDCRPSDGLALAARTEARIKVAEKVMNQALDLDFVPPPDAEQVVQVLGLTLVAVSEELREEFNLPDGENVAVSAVRQAAADRGFRRGDLILRVNGRQPVTPMEVLREVMRTESGQSAEFRLWRAGEERQISLPSAAVDLVRTKRI